MLQASWAFCHIQFLDGPGLGMTHEGEWGFEQFMADLLRAIPE